jgi:uncharacterized membrane protein
MILAILLTTHLIAVSLWIGGMFFALFILRPTLLPLPALQRLDLNAAALGRFFPWVWGFVALTLLSGFGLVFHQYGSFAHTPLPIHLMAAGGLLMALVFTMLWLRPFSSFRRAVAEQQPAAAARALGRIRSLVMVNFTVGLVLLLLGAVNQHPLP